MQRYFITGIGTDVGKTVAAAIITEALEADYWKPVQAGDLDYSDTHKVKELVSNSTSQFFPNAYALQTPMSPHASAKIDGISIVTKAIERPKTAHNLVIEGAGGILVPLSDTETILNLIAPNDKIILVSRHYLGSINHTLLSTALLKAKGFENVGILFNGNEHPTTENIIAKMSGFPVLGRIQKLNEVSQASVKLEANRLRTNLLNF